MKIKGNFVNTSFQILGRHPEILDTYIEDNELYNNPKLLFLEEQYMNQCNRFSKIVDKFKIKKFDDQLIIYKNNELITLENFSEEVKLFDQIILSNNINGLQKNDLSISINHFEKYEKSPKIKFIQSIYILLFISNMTEYSDNKFIFKITIDDKETVEKISFEKIEIFELFKIYSWIVNSKENMNTRLKIIREIIIRKNSFKLSDKDLSNAKSVFNRVIKEETDKYFEQVNMLKEDFIKLSEHRQKNYQSLHLKFLGWASSIALFIYSEIKDKPSDHLLQKLLFSKTEKSFLFLIIFILSLITIWIIFVKEICENKKEYNKIEKFYIEQLFFDKADFSNFIESPKLSWVYTLVFIILLSILFLRLAVPYCI